jgi:hypothetical protein
MSTRKFDSLTSRGKAVRVAKDVLLQLDLKKYKAKNLVYFTWDAWDAAEKDYENMGNYANLVRFEEQTLERDLKTVVAEAKQCSVCALGASICSLANVNGPVKVSDGRSGGRPQLETIFGRLQLNMMESAFEKTKMGAYWNELEHNQGDLAVKFGKKYKSAENRLRAIMNNIIQNRGVFKP